MNEIDLGGLGILLVILTGCTGLLAHWIGNLIDRLRARRTENITAERIESERAWALAEEAFAAMTPYLSEQEKTEVLRTIYARIKRHLEDHPWTTSTPSTSPSPPPAASRSDCPNCSTARTGTRS